MGKKSKPSLDFSEWGKGGETNTGNQQRGSAIIANTGKDHLAGINKNNVTGTLSRLQQ